MEKVLRVFKIKTVQKKLIQNIYGIYKYQLIHTNFEDSNWKSIDIDFWVTGHMRLCSVTILQKY